MYSKYNLYCLLVESEDIFEYHCEYEFTNYEESCLYNLGYFKIYDDEYFFDANQLDRIKLFLDSEDNKSHVDYPYIHMFVEHMSLKVVLDKI